MSIAANDPYRSKYCFAWCGQENCDCMKPERPTMEKALETIIIHAVQKSITTCNVHDDLQLVPLLKLAKNDPDNVIRAMARAKIQDNAISIIERLLNDKV